MKRRVCKKCGKGFLSLVDLMDGMLTRKATVDPAYIPKRRMVSEASSLPFRQSVASCTREDCPHKEDVPMNPELETHLSRLQSALKPVIESNMTTEEILEKLLPKIDPSVRRLVEVIIKTSRKGVFYE